MRYWVLLNARQWANSPDEWKVKEEEICTAILCLVSNLFVFRQHDTAEIYSCIQHTHIHTVGHATQLFQQRPKDRLSRPAKDYSNRQFASIEMYEYVCRFACCTHYNIIAFNVCLKISNDWNVFFFFVISPRRAFWLVQSQPSIAAYRWHRIEEAQISQ